MRSRPSVIHAPDRRRFLVDQRFQRTFEKSADRRRAIEDFIGEEPRGLGIAARQFHLGGDIAGDLVDRLARLRSRRFERRQPVGEDFFEHRDIDVLLAPEVIKEVRLRHVGALGDLVDGRAAKAVIRKDLERSREDDLVVLRLDARLGRLGLSQLGMGCNRVNS